MGTGPQRRKKVHKSTSEHKQGKRVVELGYYVDQVQVCRVVTVLHFPPINHTLFSPYLTLCLSLHCLYGCVMNDLGVGNTNLGVGCGKFHSY